VSFEFNDVNTPEEIRKLQSVINRRFTGNQNFENGTLLTVVSHCKVV